MNYGVITHTLGWVLNIEAISMLLPTLCAIFYGDTDSVKVFLLCALITLAAGLALMIKRPKSKTMYSKEGFATVALSWIFISIFGALPFIISGYIPNYIDAVFETDSGFTTTGASILTDVEVLPKALLFWRSFTHWIGGMGVLVFLVAILPLSGGGNLYLVKAESPGPSVSKLVPKIKSTAKILYLLYIAFTVLEIILLLLGGMSMFEALTLSFGTAGTGGFGIVNSSIGDYSPYIQNVITVFMILFGIDFSVYYLIVSRRFKDAFKSDEYKVYLGIIAVSIVLITINCYSQFADLGTTLRHAAFQVASVVTTTGYSTTDFNIWPSLSKTVLVTLMFIGACAGSTGGGFKVSRIIILFKSIKREIRLAVHPRSTHKITMNGRSVETQTVQAVNAYLAVYCAIFALSLLIVSINGYDYTTNFTAVLATLNNIGPGLELVGPTSNFAFFSPISKLVLILDMLIGRLEIFPMLILFSSYARRK